MERRVTGVPRIMKMLFQLVLDPEDQKYKLMFLLETLNETPITHQFFIDLSVPLKENPHPFIADMINLSEKRNHAWCCLAEAREIEINNIRAMAADNLIADALEAAKLREAEVAAEKEEVVTVEA